MAYSKIILKPNQERRILNGHLWIFSNEIEKTDPAIEPGSIVDICSHKGKFLGRGFYNPHSLISARILTLTDEPIDTNFFSKKIEAAQQIRSFIYPQESCCRLIFGESDFMPGLIIDRYNNCFVCQSYCLGMDRLMPMIFEALKKNFSAECIIKKNNSSIRELEKLDKEVNVVEGELKLPIKIEQKFDSKIINFFVDPLNGQKTGFYFDQRENREQISLYCSGKNVLDCFSYIGGFGIYAAQSGAKEVVCIDSSEIACQLLKKNTELNLANISVLNQDVFEAFHQFQIENRKFDIIVLDPPALAKSKKSLFSALRKYKKLNESAIALLNTGGILFSCSCSHHVNRADFIQMINQSLTSQNRQAQLLEMRGQARDHPILPSMPETEYLKCAILRVS